MPKLILIPPSEGKSTEKGDGAFRRLEKDLVDDAKAVLEHVDSLSAAERMKFYGMKEKEKVKAIHGMNQKALDAPCLPALLRYTGVVYSHLDYPNLKKKKKAEQRLHVVSGLFGLIAGGRRIPEYKMPINTWLAKYWKPVNATRLAAAAKGKPVLSLLPQAYSKAIDYENVIHVDFKVQGGKKSAGHHGKAIKGKFLRFLIENGIESVADFSAFTEEGYRFDGENFVQP